MKYIDDVVDEWCKEHVDDLLAMIYDMTIQYHGEEIRIEDLPTNALIISKLSDDFAQVRFDINEDWLATLELLLDVEMSRKLEESIKEAGEGRSTPFELNS